ncbi:SCO family protein [Halopseudomonas pelagia]|uniref:SCO family protein n=1 Tax=Halopseudomonas pelagia TaxID=553151 RepID=UPI0030DAAB26
MKIILIGCGVAILVLLAGLPIAYLNWPAPVPVSAAIEEGAEIGGAFELQDHHGQTVTEDTFKGRWTLVFFGFTHCPDICPTTLSHVASLLDGLGDMAEQVQPLFITLDPERDTPAILAEYAAFFDPRILGLAGSAEQTRQVADAYSVYFKKVNMGDTYTLDHTTTLYLMSPDGTFKRHYSEQMPADAMAQDIAGLLDAG